MLSSGNNLDRECQGIANMRGLTRQILTPYFLGPICTCRMVRGMVASRGTLLNHTMAITLNWVVCARLHSHIQMPISDWQCRGMAGSTPLAIEVARGRRLARWGEDAMCWQQIHRIVKIGISEQVTTGV